MKKHKPCGYYWRVRKSMKKLCKDGDEIILTTFPPRKRAYIIRMSFKDLPKITIR